MADLREQLQQDLGSAYTLEQELTGGGMSRVFVATDTALHRQVVIKILPPEMAAAVSSQRFRREIQLAANLQHPHIVPLHSAGEINGLPYFTMPYVKGESLRAHLAKVGELPLSEAIRTLREVASALAYAHENHVVHRDIKPDNVLISGGSAVVTDFGIAKALSASADEGGAGTLTSTGLAIGTPAYMAPEQATADPHVDHRADIYALGIMAYEMITGSTPFSGRSPQATLAAHAIEPPENITKRRSNIPPGLAAIVMRSLEKRPADRYQTAHDVMHDLDALTTPSGGMAPTASSGVLKPGGAKQRNWKIPLAAALAILIAGAVIFRVSSSKSSGASTQTAEEQRSLAVLPFTNMSDDASNEYFSDGLAEQLLNELAEIPGLRVAARTSSFQFKGKAADIREVASKLGVVHVLEGSVRKSGDRMRITAKLVDSKTGYQMWSETFDRTVTDVFAVQDEITKAIREALQVQLGSSSGLASGRTENQKAYDLYLKASFAQNLLTEKGMREAAQYFKDAVATDPKYAMAHAELGRVYLNMISRGYMSANVGLALSKAAIDRAMELEPKSSQIQVTLASWHNFNGDLDKAEALLSSAIQANPNLGRAHSNYANLLLLRGRAEEGLREAFAARQLDPLSKNSNRTVAVAQTLAGKYKDAIETYRAILLESPDYWPGLYGLSGALTEDGQYAEALEVAQKAHALNPDDFSVKLLIAYVHARSGSREQALKIVREAEALPDNDYLVDIGLVYAALGEKDLAFASLEKVPNIAGNFVKLEPGFNPLRGDPRFANLMKKWNVK